VYLFSAASPASVGPTSSLSIDLSLREKKGNTIQTRFPQLRTHALRSASPFSLGGMPRAHRLLIFHPPQPEAFLLGVAQPRQRLGRRAARVRNVRHDWREGWAATGERDGKFTALPWARASRLLMSLYTETFSSLLLKQREQLFLSGLENLVLFNGLEKRVRGGIERRRRLTFLGVSTATTATKTTTCGMEIKKELLYFPLPSPFYPNGVESRRHQRGREREKPFLYWRSRKSNSTPLTGVSSVFDVA